MKKERKLNEEKIRKLKREGAEYEKEEGNPVRFNYNACGHHALFD